MVLKLLKYISGAFSTRPFLNEGFLGIEEVFVPASAAEKAQNHLRLVGASGYEGFALWAGNREGTKFFVRETIIPEQTGHITPSGVYVTVGPAELHRINVWLYEHQMTLIAQLHSHPGEAYHSDTDDAFPIATTLGAFSLVIPYYARGPFSLSNCAVYRLMPRKGWSHISRSAAAKIIQITE